MTDVWMRIALAHDGDAGALVTSPGTVRFAPTSRRNSDGVAVLPEGFTVSLVAGQPYPVVKFVQDDGTTWAWTRIEGQAKGNGRAVGFTLSDKAANTEETPVEYEDVTLVDPKTFESITTYPTVAQELNLKADRAQNLADLTNPSAARTNLGLGSAAESDATDFATPADVAAETAARESLEASLPSTYALKGEAGQLGPEGITVTKAFDTQRGAYNLSAATLAKFTTALWRAKNGGSAVRVALLGDSITQGAGASVPYNVTSWPYRLVAMLQSLHGDAGQGLDPLIDTATTADPRYSTSGTWTRDATAGYVTNGRALTTVAAGATLTYASTTKRLTSLRVKYRVCSDGGTFTYAIDGGAASSAISTNGSEAIGTLDIPLTGTGTHSVVFTNVTASTRLSLLSVEEMVNSGNGGIKIAKLAQAGAAINAFNVTGDTGPMATLVDAAPDLTIIALTTNDFANWGTALATYVSRIQTVITNAATTGDVMLVIGPTPQRRRGPDGVGDTSDDIDMTTSPTWLEYRQALYTLADDSDIALLDLPYLWGDWDAADALGWMDDDYHPNDAGHMAYAMAVGNALAAPPTATAKSYPELDVAQAWLANQAIGHPSSVASRVTVGSTELATNPTSPTNPHVTATVGGSLYLASKAGQTTYIFGKVNFYDSPLNVKVYATASRPTAASAGAGAMLFDSTLGIPVWSNGTAWVDAAGATV